MRLPDRLRDPEAHAVELQENVPSSARQPPQA
jgi:hypothetical protein